MQKPIIKISFKQVIDINCQGSFEKEVFNDSYREFLMQAQVYNPGNKMRTFQELVNANPKANSLHYKIGFSVGLYVNNLRRIMPSLNDSLGRPLHFAEHRFEVLESDITNRSAHKVAITYTSDNLILLDVISDYLLLTSEKPIDDNQDQMRETFLLQLQSGLGISSYQVKENVLFN